MTRHTSRTTPSGTVTIKWENTYDSKGNVTSITDPDGNVSYTEYNTIGKKSAEINKLGRRTEYVYDDRGNEIEKIYADGTKETATFDANGNRTSSTDRGGRTTYYEYDQNIDRINKVIFPTGGFIRTDTDETGSYVAITDDKGNQTIYEYDSDGNMIKTKNALSDSTVYTYDANGNQISMTDANGNTIFYEYDFNNRKTKTIYPDGTFISTAYDIYDNKISETDQAGNTTLFEYDALSRLTKVIDALGNETSYTYDETGNKTTQTDANGNTTRWEYDNLGRVIKRTLPLGQFEIFTYDAVGNVLTHTDFNGNTIVFNYDENNRLIKKSFLDGSEEVYSYTATGRKDTVIDSRGTTLNFYDSGDRLTRVVNPDESMIKYEYDTMGNRTAIIIDQDTTRYTFDQLNRLKTVIDPDSGITTYTYDAVGNRSSITYPNMTVAEYTYDSKNRLVTLYNHKSNGDTISCYSYTLGPAGNRIKVTEHNGRTVDYSYDATYKLIQERIDDPDFGLRVIKYTYDSVGNRLTKIDNNDTTTYTYNENDRMLTENSQHEIRNYTYDNNGNTLTKTSLTENIAYTYDYLNRLIQVNDGTSVVEYIYDTDGIRVQKVVDGLNTINYIVDKNRDYAQVLQERDKNGTVIVSYNYGDDLISQKRNSSLLYYHYDGQMSTRQLTDVDQNITDGYTYDAFGILLNKFGATFNNYLYTGEQHDPNVGFYYLRARYYNNSIGRFLTMDTWPGSGFEPASLHKYLYCEGNPVVMWDPSGRRTLIETVAKIGIGMILVSVIYTNAIHLLSWLADKREPVEWSGNMVYTTYSPKVLGWGWGLILAGLTGHKEGEPSLSASYIIFVAGISFAPLSALPWKIFKLNWAIPLGGIELETPGLLGLRRILLCGPVSWLSFSRVLGAGKSDTNFYMGMGRAFYPKPDWLIGIDVGAEAMGGWSF